MRRNGIEDDGDVVEYVGSKAPCLCFGEERCTEVVCRYDGYGAAGGQNIQSNYDAALTRKTAEYVLDDSEKDSVGCGRVGFTHAVA